MIEVNVRLCFYLCYGTDVLRTVESILRPPYESGGWSFIFPPMIYTKTTPTPTKIYRKSFQFKTIRINYKTNVTENMFYHVHFQENGRQ